MEIRDKGMMPTNGMVEPDFLEYLKKTFKEWQQLKEEGVALGSRAIGICKNTIDGARLNCRFGFEYEIGRTEREFDGQEVVRLVIYNNTSKTKNNPEKEVAYLFEAEVCK